LVRFVRSTAIADIAIVTSCVTDDRMQRLAGDQSGAPARLLATRD
jgi:hypothetical protein